MKKRDWVILTIVLGLVLVLAAIWNVFYSQTGEKVIVAVNNIVLLEEDLSNTKYFVIDKSRAYEVENEKEAIARLKSEKDVTNVLIISDGKADMIDADCPDRICVGMKPINNIGESIVCMPNKLYVTIE